MPVIEVNGVSKVFRRNAGRKLLRQQIADLLRKRSQDDYFPALKNVTFQVSKGEGVGLVGANGAGKSTLLSLVSGLTEPTTGTVKVEGRTAALLEMGSGFHMDLTGAENVFVNAALLGFSEQEAKDRFADIVEFADIGEFINEPLRTYSSGMLIRLAFSVAVHVNPATLIVDEVLAVGDAKFQQKCSKKVAELRSGNTAMLLVSHSPAMVSTFCDRAIWLHHGEIVLDGPAGQVTQEYARFMADPAARLPVPEAKPEKRAAAAEISVR